ncbi:uncharacterized protein NECHADRAFT_97577 [Fusarium vanettenii 77-13-4]|uniref:Aminotransferase class I/classII large domain-containing protein n=1 Tax=Fusarium vanettenii (strain ATCC MYA-4622 / CBS 123669 / FGSC 9596 / NRRL 45880 / 77-13-4) TaxID=660122 RepID=C7ZLF3_FUSV7|nr:uncharacterized protein NECHADRAFT_97577 [Fusarium vanettenii 77-13-4]EEU35186.1 hypothetical protein NECHADRAFT_97577 [Fusarium vanettenii 77-13-4]
MLSARGTAWTRYGYLHGKENAYDPVKNPKGDVILTNAFNHDLDKSLLTYGEGYTGTLRLRSAMAKHLNRHFHPAQAIDAEEITFTAGVTNLNEVCALVTCDPGEAIMLGRPIYGPFSKDFVMRTGVNLEYVSVGDTDQFSPGCIAGYEAGFEDAKARGVNIKALVICNPHNPIGQCYPRETLVALLKFCASKGIHLISDEIYALSVYSRDGDGSEKFTSLRAVDPSGIIDPSQVHILHGMSKDYAAAGLRLGCVITQNKEFSKAVRAICRFSSPSQLSMDLAAKFLEDEAFVDQFLEKSRARLHSGRALTDTLLKEANIDYHEKGQAEKRFSQRLTRAGVIMDTGSEYRAPRAGRFRLMFTVDEGTLREGVKRLVSSHMLVMVY